MKSCFLLLSAKDGTKFQSPPAKVNLFSQAKMCFKNWGSPLDSLLFRLASWPEHFVCVCMCVCVCLLYVCVCVCVHSAPGQSVSGQENETSEARTKRRASAVGTRTGASAKVETGVLNGREAFLYRVTSKGVWAVPKISCGSRYRCVAKVAV